MPSAASAMSGEWAATETGRSDAAPRAQLLRAGSAGLDGRSIAGDDDLAGSVSVGDGQAAVRRSEGDQFGQACDRRGR